MAFARRWLLLSPEAHLGGTLPDAGDVVGACINAVSLGFVVPGHFGIFRHCAYADIWGEFGVYGYVPEYFALAVTGEGCGGGLRARSPATRAMMSGFVRLSAALRLATSLVTL